MSHKPTAAQLARLATLQQSLATASAALTTAQASLATAQTNYRSAASAAKEYEALIYGGTSGLPSSVLDIGSLDNA